MVSRVLDRVPNSPNKRHRFMDLAEHDYTSISDLGMSGQTQEVLIDMSHVTLKETSQGAKSHEKHILCPSREYVELLVRSVIS